MEKFHITLLGKECLPAYYPIIEFHPDFIYIIGTEQNAYIARRLQKVLSSKGFRSKALDVDAFDIRSIIAQFEAIHAQIDPGSEVTYNITGGTKLMAIGAYIVARQHNAQVVYTNSDSYIDLNTFESHTLNCTVDNETIFALQGQILKSYEVYREDKDTLSVAYQIMNFIRHDKKIYARLHNLHIKQQLQKFYHTDTLLYRADENSISIENEGKVLLQITHPNARLLLWEGRWWEILVSHAIYEWSNGRYVIWHSVIFDPKDKDAKAQNKDKNEIDILINTGNKLLFVECKSGNATQDTINKMGMIRQIYGSDKSSSVLVSFYPIRKELYEKARESKLNVIRGDSRQNALEQIADRFDKIIKSIKA